MKNIFNISIIVKTFMRPICLANLLESIKIYEEKYQKSFAQIIIVDDSDNSYQLENKTIIEKYSHMNIEYYNFEFNSVALSKGRNIAISHVKSDYFILCDDDTLFCTDCNIETNVQLLEQKNLDILGGYYRDIKKINSTTYNKTNWLGFITENEDYDLCNIFGDFFPEYSICDIVQNFFIAKTKTVKQIKYPETLPVLEHNVYFLLIKQKGLKVGFTKNLYVNHLHIDNQKKSYRQFRNRIVKNPIDKKVIGYYYNGNKIIKFHDYLHIGKDEQYIKVTKKSFSFKKFFKHILKGDFRK